MINSLDVADYILRKHGGLMPLSRLNALAYVAQGWSLALRSLPLYSDAILVDDSGPYLRMFQMEGDDPQVGYYWIGGTHERLSADDRELLDKLIDTYDGAPLDSLITELVRPGSPWDITRRIDLNPVTVPTARLHAYYRDRLNVDERSFDDYISPPASGQVPVVFTQDPSSVTDSQPIAAVEDAQEHASDVRDQEAPASSATAPTASEK